MWAIEKIEISGGFLPGLSINIPRGLICIIGARGSGKSTLAEAVRFAFCGTSALPKHSVDLIQANLAGGALVTVTALAEGSNRYTLKRSLKQNPVLLTSDGRTVNSVDVDRGTFRTTHDSTEMATKSGATAVQRRFAHIVLRSCTGPSVLNAR
jgi:DNA repair exonuclease SbcCD ATPase subunit